MRPRSRFGVAIDISTGPWTNSARPSNPFSVLIAPSQLREPSFAFETHQHRRPLKLNLDGNAASHRALYLLRQENPEWKSVAIRSRRYLNNIVEQDHRAIKRRCAPMLALKSFRTAAITLAGVELAHRIRKGQFSIGSCTASGLSSLKQLWARALEHPSAVVNCARCHFDEAQPPTHQNAMVLHTVEPHLHSVSARHATSS